MNSDSHNVKNMQIYLTDECVKGLIRSIASLMIGYYDRQNEIIFSFSLSLHNQNTCKHDIVCRLQGKSNVLIAFATQRNYSCEALSM